MCGGTKANLLVTGSMLDYPMNVLLSAWAGRWQLCG